MTALLDIVVPDTNPYVSPLYQPLLRRRKRFPPFVTGLVGLAMAAGFCCVIAVTAIIGFHLRLSGMPRPVGIAVMIGVAALEVGLLLLWIAAQRRLYRIRLWVFWALAIAAWLLAPLFVAVQISVLYIFASSG
jgi:hypothetical protein